MQDEERYKGVGGGGVARMLKITAGAAVTFGLLTLPLSFSEKSPEMEELFITEP